MKTKFILGCMFAAFCAPALYADGDEEETTTEETTETVSIDVEEVSSTEHHFAFVNYNESEEEALEEVNTEDAAETEHA